MRNQRIGVVILVCSAAMLAALACGPGMEERLDGFVASDAAAQTPTFSEVSCVEVDSSVVATTLERLSGGTTVTTRTVRLYGHTWSGEQQDWLVRRVPVVETDAAINRCDPNSTASCIRTPPLSDAFEATHAYAVEFPASNGEGTLFAPCGSLATRLLENFDANGTLLTSNEDPPVELRYRVWTARIR